MKSFTDLEQSKMLAEFLSVESADLMFVHSTDLEGNEHYDIDFRNKQPLLEGDIPCWSLAALLDIIRNNGRYELQMYEGGYYFEFCLGSSNFMTETYLNSVDACYEMIVNLKEKNII